MEEQIQNLELEWNQREIQREEERLRAEQNRANDERIWKAIQREEERLRAELNRQAEEWNKELQGNQDVFLSPR